MNTMELKTGHYDKGNEKEDHSPLYCHSAAYAREHDEMEAYRTSYRANIACKNAIEDAIRENYHDNHLDTRCVQGIIERFGSARVKYVLVNTIQQKDWDERFSRDNREWAALVPVAEDSNEFIGDRRTAFVVDTHSGLTNLFISAFRKEMRQRSQALHKRESVLSMLQQPVPGHSEHTSHKPKAMERG